MDRNLQSNLLQVSLFAENLLRQKHVHCIINPDLASQLSHFPTAEMQYSDVFSRNTFMIIALMKISACYQSFMRFSTLLEWWHVFIILHL